MPQAGRQQQIQLGQERSETQSNKGQRQWRSRGGRSQQQLQYMWRPVAREKEDQQVQQHDQQQHQPHQRGQQQEEQHQKQQESQQQRRTQQQDGPNEQQQQCKEQHQQKQQEKQQQHQPRQRQKPVPSRPACVRPQLAGGVSTVVVELHRLQRQFSSSFSLLSCHPLLLPLLQQQPYSASKDGSFPREAGSHPPGTPHPAAAARPAANHSSSTDYATPGALASAALTVDCSKETQGNCHLSCGHGAPTGGGEAGSGVPEAASSILCRFELLLVPTDPDFDANMLPGGLRLCVTMGREYPGAEAVLKDSAGVKEDFSDVAHHAVVAVTAANASSLSEGSTGSPEPGRAAEDGHPSGPSGQRAAVAGTATIASSSAEGCGRTASHSSFGVRQEGGAAVKGLSRGSSSDVAVLEVCNKDINDLRRDAIELVFSKVIEQQLARHERTDLVPTVYTIV
ncbi:LOW QUALITY PROTEIN: zinc finger (CHY type) protein, putative [Eimeria mitis]|uniref:Zinc finger (CHY type) protein, putative n=1 Tax=Eimeria mitis TaxID=44415 RepID=U6KIV7_9EIME|nr:LOW QUALITY PROTEIN: zinc finger (CHY type) protein, putative [Eimeria mitis]CDJ36751.1 zinc finger (CHY type) protein, putative [Eimeria mitis]